MRFGGRGKNEMLALRKSVTRESVRAGVFGEKLESPHVDSYEFYEARAGLGVVFAEVGFGFLVSRG